MSINKKRLKKKLLNFMKAEHKRYGLDKRQTDFNISTASRFIAEALPAIQHSYIEEKGIPLFKDRSSGYKEKDIEDIKKKMGGDKQNFHYKEIQNRNQGWYASNDSETKDFVKKIRQVNPEIHNDEKAPEFLRKLIHFSENSNHGDHLIMHPKDPNRALIAHELGHSRPEGAMNKRLRGVLTHPALLATSVAAMSLAAPKNKNIRRALIAAPLLTAAPTLYEEARANYHARKHLKEMGIYDKEDRDVLKKSYGTYLKSELFPALVTSAVNYGIHRKIGK